MPTERPELSDVIASALSRQARCGDAESIESLTQLNAQRLVRWGLDRAHYGSGADFRKGWVNIDIQTLAGPTDRPYVSADLTGRHPFPDACFQFGFSQDFLEHLSQADSLRFLYEVYRCLKPGGVMRLSFPGLQGVLRRHYRGHDFEDVVTGEKEAYLDWEHLHFYGPESLSQVARHIGFSEVRLADYGQSQFPALRGLDTREDQRDVNIYVELIK